MRLALCGLAFLLSLFAAGAQAGTVLYVYDELGRLVAEIDPAADTTLYIYDAAGNLLSVSRGSSSQFRLIGFAPTRGKVGDTVTIYGSGFIANPAQNTVAFNGTPATVSAASATSLVVTAPAGVTTGPIAVSNANGSAVSAQPFIVIAPPVISAVIPSAVPRGATTRITISGSQLATTRAVSFGQAGIVPRIIPGTSDTALAVDLTVAGSVPVGAYVFSVTNDAGTTSSGSVTVTVSTSLLGDVVTMTRPMSVHLPGAVAGAPAGNSMSIGRPLSVHLPAVIPGAPQGNAMGVSQPLSVHLQADIPGAPAGNAMSVTQPVSVSMP